MPKLCVQWCKRPADKDAFRYCLACAATATERSFPLIRRCLLIGIDALLLPLAVWLSFWLRQAHPFHPSFLNAGTWLLMGVILVGLPSLCPHEAIQRPTRYVR